VAGDSAQSAAVKVVYTGTDADLERTLCTQRLRHAPCGNTPPLLPRPPWRPSRTWTPLTPGTLGQGPDPCVAARLTTAQISAALTARPAVAASPGKPGYQAVLRAPPLGQPDSVTRCLLRFRPCPIAVPGHAEWAVTTPGQGPVSPILGSTRYLKIITSPRWTVLGARVLAESGRRSGPVRVPQGPQEHVPNSAPSPRLRKKKAVRPVRAQRPAHRRPHSRHSPLSIHPPEPRPTYDRQRARGSGTTPRLASSPPSHCILHSCLKPHPLRQAHRLAAVRGEDGVRQRLTFNLRDVFPSSFFFTLTSAAG